jgi:hypothetical protein
LSDTASRLDTWIWVFIYAAIFGLGLGLSIWRTDSGLGWTIGSFGAFFLVIGMAMVWARSRAKSPS